MTFASVASAQMDRVYTVGSNSASAGNRDRDIEGRDQTEDRKELPRFLAQRKFARFCSNVSPPNSIVVVSWQSMDNTKQALTELKGIDTAKISRDVIRVDAAYLVVLCNAKLALAGRGDRNAASAAALKFAGQNSDSYHFYPVAKLLGDLALATKSYDKAIQYYGALMNAPSAESKIESRYLTGVATLEKGDVAKAQEAFSAVASVTVNSSDAFAFQNPCQGRSGRRTCPRWQRQRGTRTGGQLDQGTQSHRH